MNTENDISNTYSLLSEGRILEAREKADNLLEKNKQSIEVWILRCFVEIRLKNYIGAKELTEKAINIFPKSSKLLNILGISNKYLDNFDEAIDAYKKSIENDNQDPDPYKNLGVLHFENNNYQEALFYLSEYEKFIDNIDPEIFLIISKCYSGLKDYKKAIKVLKESIVRYENILELRIEVATIYQIIGKKIEAIDELKKIVEINKDFKQGYNSIGLLYAEMNETRNAIKYYDKALEIDSNYFDALVNMGNSFQNDEIYDIALNYYERALNINPNNADLLANLGSLFLKKNNATKSIELFTKSLEIRPNNSKVQYNLGMAFKNTGYNKEAGTCFREALKNDPNYGDCFYALTHLEKLSINDAIFENAIQKVDNINDKDAKSSMLFAISKVYHDNNMYAEASKHLIKGNKEYREILKFDSKNAIKDVFETWKSFNKKPSKDYKNSKFNHDYQPVFIVGLPRSGTTLLEQIMSNHDKVYAGGELKFINQALTKSGLMENIVNKDSNIDDDIWKNFANIYLDSLNVININNSPYITDKLPGNFLNCHIIINTFPNAKIINLNRDTKDIRLSLYQTKFAASHPYCYDQGDIKEYEKYYNDIMAFFLEKYPSKIFQIQYEDLVTKPKKEVKKLFEWMDLDYNDDLLNTDSNKIIKTASDVNARKPIFKTSIDKYKNYEEYLPELFKEE